MTWWPEHPDDQWVDVTPLGSAETVVVRGMSGAAAEVGLAREKYVTGLIEIEDFEAVVDRVLFGERS